MQRQEMPHERLNRIARQHNYTITVYTPNEPPKVISQPAPPTDGKTRKLKVCETGDAWKGKIKPSLRLTGNWLARAGFAPGKHVQITVNQGELIIKIAQ